MAKAKVTLSDTGPVTFHGRGYSLSQGRSCTVTNEADIRYFMSQGGFQVDLMEGFAPKVAAVEADEDEDEAVGDDSAPPAPPADEVDDGPATPEYTEADLSTMTKGALMTLAKSDNLPVKLDNAMSKAEMVKAIIKAQPKG